MVKAELVAHMGDGSQETDEWMVQIKAETIGRHLGEGIRCRSQMYYRELVLCRATSRHRAFGAPIATSNFKQYQASLSSGATVGVPLSTTRMTNSGSPTS
jgi:hypothetical protein